MLYFLPNLPNQQTFREYIFYQLLTKWFRGPDEMASRAGFGPWAVVWGPLFYLKTKLFAIFDITVTLFSFDALRLFIRIFLLADPG